MIDFFDSGFEQSQAPAPAPRRAYEVLPEGEHELEIVAASVGTVEWKATDANPEGQCLRIRLSAGPDFAFVFVDLPRDRSVLFRALAAALGMQTGPDGKVSIGPPEALVGRTVRVATGRYTTRAGETRANVRRWIPAPSAAPPAARQKPPRARPQGFKAAGASRANVVEDDIPF
jgi:hypothetical protein